ncbi:MAG: ABC transporter ATP-binding protein [Syntrophobacteraceae bacterium]|jgi:branched-chain amino acid transport system ATP-binding protein
MLRVEKINTFYGSSHILQDVSLEVHQGEVVVLLGRNGVGKTTTLKSIMGIQPPKSGRIIYKGEDITGNPSFQNVRKGLALIPEDRRIFPNLTVEENLLLGILHKRKHLNVPAQFDMVFGYFPKLKQRAKQMGGSLSGGEQQMLTIARALISNPELMMIDEPTEGLAPLIVEEIAEILRRLEREGTTMLLVEQNYQLSLSLCDNQRAYIMEKGQVKLSGTPRELQECMAEVEQCLGVKLLC